MRSTFSLLLYINRNKVRVDGTTSVLCRISIDGKNTVITTGISCPPTMECQKCRDLRCTDKQPPERVPQACGTALCGTAQEIWCCKRGTVEERNCRTCRSPRSFTPDGRKGARTPSNKSQRNRVKLHIQKFEILPKLYPRVFGVKRHERHCFFRHHRGVRTGIQGLSETI